MNQSAQPKGTNLPLYRLIVAGLLLGCALFLLLHTYAPEYTKGMFATAPNAMALPRVLLAIWIALCTAVLMMEWRNRVVTGYAGLPVALRLCLFFIISALALPHVGFAAVVTPLVLAALFAMGERRPVVLLAATALLGPGLWFLFHHVLLIRLPSVLPGGLL